MKTHVAVLALMAAVAAPSALGDGQMTFPPPRDVVPLRERCYVGVDLAEMATSSIEKLEKKTSTKAAQCGLRDGCRGTVADESTYSAASLRAQAYPTVFEYETDITVTWDILAAAPGYLELNLIMPSEGDGDHEAKYEKALTLKKVLGFGGKTGPGNTTIQITTAFPYCEKEGACALQFHWRSDATDQTFDICADFTMNPSDESAWILDNENAPPAPDLPDNVLPETEPGPEGPTELTPDEGPGPTELEGSMDDR